MSTIKEILNGNNLLELKALFTFDSTDSDESVLFKYNLWARKYHAKYFTSSDAPFHKEIDLYNLQIYRGKITTFVNIAFRGAAKTARTKLFLAFCICNDRDHFRKYIKVLSEDDTNSKQITTDIYNILVNPQIKILYPELWEKSDAKREETMSTFTTSTGIKMLARTVIAEKRGALQEESRPDVLWFEDFENRKTLRSNRVTKSLAENMEEARTGLAKNGGSIYTCNYISEQGNVHQLVVKASAKKKVLIQSILNDDGTPSWNRYTIADVEQMRQDDEDFEGERLCKPSASREVLFDREALDKQIPKTPFKTSAGFKMYKQFNPSHRYASGHDVAGGVGLDSSSSVFIDFDTIPAQVVGTFYSNSIKPDTMGDEVSRETDLFGGCIAGIEKNNHGHATIARAKQLEVNLYYTQPKDTRTQIATQAETPKEYGWHTNALSKPKMIFAFSKAVEDGLIELNDPDLIAECKSYTRNDLIEIEKDPRLTTRHFDLFIGACIAWQMKDWATIQDAKEDYVHDEEELNYPQIGM